MLTAYPHLDKCYQIGKIDLLEGLFDPLKILSEARASLKTRMTNWSSQVSLELVLFLQIFKQSIVITMFSYVNLG